MRNKTRSYYSWNLTFLTFDCAALGKFFMESRGEITAFTGINYDYCKTITGAPSSTRLYKSTISSFNRRMHPLETAFPIELGSFVPWMRK
jgi:hypothetical protein